MNSLQAWMNDHLVGTLSAHDDVFSFRYTEEWKRFGHALTPFLPLDDALLSSGELSSNLKVFLSNQLPEGTGLDGLAKLNGLSKNNLFGLLRCLGRDGVGALTLLPESEIKEPATHLLRPIPQLELLTRIQNRAHQPFCQWDNKIRLSIAGYQDKIQVYLDNGAFYFAEYPLASTHILKPLPQDARFKHLVANEHFCMKLAALIGINTAKSHIVRIQDEPILAVERFDRVLSEDRKRVSRLHIIDACQALNLSCEYKNERNFGNGRDVAHIRDGVSFKRLFSLNRYTQSSISFSIDLLRWSVFQYLIGNSDAHGKNISFFFNQDGLKQAPAYDLVCTAIYEDLDNHLAMSIGDEFKFNDIQAYQWYLFSEDCNIPIDLLKFEMENLAKKTIFYTKKLLSPKFFLDNNFNKNEKSTLIDMVGFMQNQASILIKQAKLVDDFSYNETPVNNNHF